MKIAAVALVISALAAGSASAAVTDVDYLKANRCKGLAAGIEGVVDSEGFSQFIKAERGARPMYIMERADREFQKARREAKSRDSRERLTAELTGPCQAYLGGPTSVAKQ